MWHGLPRHAVASCELFLGVSRGLLDDALLKLPFCDNEMVVLSVSLPRPPRHIANIDKLPICYISRLKPEVIPNSRRNIKPGTVVEVGFWPLALEDVLKMIGAE